MFNHTLKRLPKATLEIIVDISKQTIDVEYQKAFSDLQKELEVEGFRKGKVPKQIAEKHIKKEQVFDRTIRNILPKIYDEIVKKENLKPIISPKIDLIKAKEGEDWQLKIAVAEKPIVELGDYKTTIEKAKKEAKTPEIWVPGKEGKEKSQEENKQKILNEILNVLIKEVKFELSDLIVEDELNRRLSQLVDDIQKLGLTTEAYLKSKNTTLENLKDQYKREITDTYKLEFILNEIADKEGIKVEDADLKKLFENIKDEKEKKIASENTYFYASILRKQKTLDFLISL